MHIKFDEPLSEFDSVLQKGGFIVQRYLHTGTNNAIFLDRSNQIYQLIHNVISQRISLNNCMISKA